MNVLKVRRFTGAFGIAGFVVFLLALPLYFFVPQPSTQLQDPVLFTNSVSRASPFILTRATLADPLIIACLLIFLAGFRHLIRQASEGAEWIGTLVLGAGLVMFTLGLAGDALEGGAALDTSLAADPSVVRGLMEGSFAFYGAIGLIMEALLLASAGSAILISGVLPRWTGWLAETFAVVNLVAAPSIFFGTDYTGFYTATGWVTFIGQATVPIWFLVASISLLTGKREAKAMTPAYGG